LGFFVFFGVGGGGGINSSRNQTSKYVQPWFCTITAAPISAAITNICYCGPHTFALLSSPVRSMFGAFAKLGKVTTGFAISVRLSAWNNSASTGLIFTICHIWVFFEKSVQKIQVSLKSDKNKGYNTRTNIHFFIISRSIVPNMRNVSDKRYTENQNAHFMFNNVFWRSCRLWDNVEK